MPNKPEMLELPDQPAVLAKPDQPSMGNVPFLQHLEQVGQRQKVQYDLELQGLRKQRIQQIQQKRNSQVIVYYSVDLLDYSDPQDIFEVLSCYPTAERLDLFLLSPGGYSGAAFKISRMFQELTDTLNGHFSILVPFYAKSAATILSLGADEIIMGLPSELGPIDPQLPTREGAKALLALKDAIDYVKSEVATNPETAQLFWPLINQIQLMELGQYEREISSAKQYAQQLLASRMFKNEPDKAMAAAEKLTSAYKTHGYIIDRLEARETLGLNIVDADPELWTLMWELHKLYDLHIKKSISENTNQVKLIESLHFLSVKILNTANTFTSLDGGLS